MKTLLSLAAFGLLSITVNAQTFLNHSFENNTATTNTIMATANVNDTVPYVHGISGPDFYLQTVYGTICDTTVSVDGNWHFKTLYAQSAFAMELDQVLNAGIQCMLSFFARNCTTEVEVVIGQSDQNNTFGTAVDTVVVTAPTAWTQYTTPTFTAPITGEFITLKVLVPNNYNEVDFDNFVLQIISSDKGRSVAEQNVTLYPNPVRDNLTITAGENIRQVLVTDITGKHVIETNPGSAQTTLSTKNLPSGVYFVQITAGDQTRVHKVVKN